MRVRLRRERLLEILAGSPLSQNQWATRLGLSRGHWSDLVNGRHPYPSAKTRARMLEVFGVGAEELFEIEVRPEPRAPRPPLVRGDGLGTDLPRRGAPMSRIWEDVRFALRSLRRRPAFAVAVLGILALAIAANGSVFSLANAVIFRPLPYHDETRLYGLWGGDEDGRIEISARERAAYRAEPGLFAGVGTWFDDAATVTGGADPELVPVSAIDAAVLPVLGVSPLLGRPFTLEEDKPGADRVALLSHSYWVRRFGGDRSVLGRTLVVDGVPREIIGVLPAEARLPSGFQGAGASLFVPLAPDPVPDPRNFHYLRAVVRLPAGADPRATQSALDVVVTRLKAEIPTLPPDFTARINPLRRDILGDSRPIALLLLGAVGLMLLVAAANVAGLVLANAEGRHRELAVRTALGADRSRLGRQLVAESLVSGLLGGGLGLLLAAVAVRVLGALSLALPRAAEIRIDVPTVLYTFALAMAAALLAGVIPAWQIAGRPDLLGALAEGARGTSTGPARARIRRGLVVAEMALAVTLAVGAGLMVKTWRNVLASHPGFTGERALTLRVSLPSSEFPERVGRRRFYRELVTNVGELPGVERVGATRALPLVSRVGDWGFTIDGRPPVPENERKPFGDWHVITDGYFEAIGVPLVEGRTFTAADDTTSLGVVVINRALARRYWGAESPIGSRIKMSSNVDTLWRTVVGVVGDVRQRGLELEPRPEYFLPHGQYPRTNGNAPGEMFLVVKTAADPAAMTAAIRGVVRTLTPSAPVSDVRTVAEVQGGARAGRRFQLGLLGAFALAAVALLGVGVYGVVAQLVGQRTREFGIRLALGASTQGVERMVLREQVGPLAIGLGIGLAGGLGLAVAMRSVLYQVRPGDPIVLAAAVVIVGLAVVIGTLVPARRAAATELTEVLRAE